MRSAGSIVLAVLGALVLALAVQAQEAGTVPAEHVTMPAPAYHPEWFKSSFLDLPEDIEEAAGQGKGLIVYFYQHGCPYCKKLIEHNLGQPEVVAFTREHFEVVAINIYGSVEVTDPEGEVLDERDFAKKVQVHFTPTMLVYNKDREVVFRMNGYYNVNKFSAMLAYLAEKQETKMKFLDYLAAYQSTRKPQALDIGPLASLFMTAPFDLQETLRTEARPLAVYVQEQDCTSCKELNEDILQRPETRKFLEQFSLAMVDVHSDASIVSPRGKKSTSRQWVRDNRIQFIPTLVLYDTSGREVFRVDGYVKSYHLQSALDYVLTESYKRYTGFQRFLQDRTDRLEAQGVHVDLMD